MARIYKFGEARARPGDPDASHEAASRVRGRRATRIGKKIVWLLNKWGERGGNWHEIWKGLKLDILPESLSPRWTELRDLGVIQWRRDANDEIFKRPSPVSKEPQGVLIVTQKGKDILPLWLKQWEEEKEKKKQREEAKKRKEERKRARENK